MIKRVIKSVGILMACCAMGVSSAEAQESVDSLSVTFDFRVSKTVIDPNFSDNRQVAEELHAALDSLGGDERIEVLGLHLDGTASPEGSHKFNMYLSRTRLKACEELIEQWITVPDSVVTRNIGYIAWSQLRDSLVNCPELEYQEDALKIIDGYHELEIVNGREVDTRVGQLKRLRGGAPWREMLQRFFPDMRAARMTLVYRRTLPLAGEAVAPEFPVAEMASAADFKPAFVREEPAPPEPTPPAPEPEPQNLYIKTNLVGWALADANLGVEWQFKPHWSVGVHAYYGAIDLPSYKLKFRTLTIQPELRYWINRNWTVGIHPTLAWWNYGTNGEYRRQDHNGSSPAWGGGLAVAWHKQLSRHWFFEASAGGGVYRLHYDKYINRKNGPLVGEVRTTKLLVDQVSASFVYRFQLK